MFSFLNRVAINASVERLAKAAVSPEAFQNGVGTAFTTRETFSAFYNKYGSRMFGFRYNEKPAFYIGYIQPADEEFLCAIVLLPEGKGSVVASFRPELDQPGSISNTLTKMRFQEEVTQGFIENNTF